MQEIELKFQIPADALDAVRAELARLAPGQALPEPLTLQAAYFDTPDRRLAAARSALRVRREGDDWVQTLKAAGSHTMVRVEDNRPTAPPPPGQPLAARLSLHAGGPAEAALREALGWAPETDPHGERCGLVALYRTDMQRTRVQWRVGVGTLHEGLVELALDEGAIVAGPAEAEHRVPVRELEIELLEGHPQAVIDAGRDWVSRFGLWLDTQTKAHRGDRLARLAVDGDAGAALPQAFKPRPARLPATGLDTLTAQAAWRAGTEACLAHITAHMSELASLADADDAALVTAQWRRGLRGLRALGRLVEASLAQGHALGVPPAALIALQEACRLAAELSRQLGPWRDQDALAWVSDALKRAGVQAAALPPLPRPSEGPASPMALARTASATEVCLLVLTALVSPIAEHSPQQDDPPHALAPLSARDWLGEALRDGQRRCLRTSRRFDTLGSEATHRLRRRLRQLRDLTDLFAPLWPDEGEAQHRGVQAPQAALQAARQAAMKDALKHALKALGRIQDVEVARSRFAAGTDALGGGAGQRDGTARQACQWLDRQRKPLRKQAGRALRRWRRRAQTR